MRETKFRAWCTYEEKMYVKFYIDEHATYAFMHELLESAKERYKLMQYTGLQDIKGLGIYEGDILKDSGKAIRVVIFENGAFGYISKTRTSFYSDATIDLFVPLYQHLEELEIIGNRFENPELLGGNEE